MRMAGKAFPLGGRWRGTRRMREKYPEVAPSSVTCGDSFPQRGKPKLPLYPPRHRSPTNWNFTYLDNGNVNFPDNKKYSRSKPTIIRIPPTTLMPIRLTLLFFIILFAKTNSSAPTTIIKTDINGYMSFLLSNSDLSVLHQPNLPRHYTKNASKRCRSSIFTVAR